MRKVTAVREAFSPADVGFDQEYGSAELSDTALLGEALDAALAARSAGVLGGPGLDQVALCRAQRRAFRRDVEWMNAGACRDASGDAAEGFFAPPGMRSLVDAAKAVCRSCPVKAKCLEYAVATWQLYGVWGGRDEDERRECRRQQRKAG